MKGLLGPSMLTIPPGEQINLLQAENISFYTLPIYPAQVDIFVRSLLKYK